eukprot:scaffold190404_cov67-Attheya_sp.AAC.1
MQFCVWGDLFSSSSFLEAGVRRSYNTESSTWTHAYIALTVVMVTAMVVWEGHCCRFSLEG